METPREITDAEIDVLTQSILTRYGIDFTCYEPTSLKRRIVRVLSVFQFESIYSLWARMLREREFIYSFMDEISVGMTSMFRDPILWINLKRLAQQQFNNAESLSVWHAGCSTGEEVYSLSILLNELGLLNKARTFASDINQAAIREAQAGKYHKIKMIENERNFKEYNPFTGFQKYYAPSDDGRYVVMDRQLIEPVSFGYHNLITDEAQSKYNLILCRNVMIYFDNQAKITLLEKFYTALKPGGYFCIGFYDTMLPLIDQHKFELIDAEAKIFRKVGA